MDCGGWMLTSAKVVAPVAAASHNRAVNRKSLSIDTFEIPREVEVELSAGLARRSDEGHSLMS